MKNFNITRLSLLLIFVGVFSSLCGCSSACADGSGDGKLSAAWSELRFPIVEGGEICACSKYASCDDFFTVTYKTDEFLTLIDKYKEQLKANGWTILPDGKDRGSIYASKDDKNISVNLFFIECTKSFVKPGTWSNCTNVSVKKIK